MTDFKYDTTFQGGYNPGTPEGVGIPEYNNMGQLQTPYFGKRFGVGGDYGPIYQNPFDPHGMKRSSGYAPLDPIRHVPNNTAYGPDLSFPSAFTPPNMGVYAGYPPHPATYVQPQDVKFVRGNSLIGAIVFPGNMGRLPASQGIQFYAKEREYGSGL